MGRMPRPGLGMGRRRLANGGKKMHLGLEIFYSKIKQRKLQNKFFPPPHDSRYEKTQSPPAANPSAPSTKDSAPGPGPSRSCPAGGRGPRGRHRGALHPPLPPWKVGSSVGEQLCDRLNC